MEKSNLCGLAVGGRCRLDVQLHSALLAELSVLRIRSVICWDRYRLSTDWQPTGRERGARSPWHVALKTPLKRNSGSHDPQERDASRSEARDAPRQFEIASGALWSTCFRRHRTRHHSPKRFDCCTARTSFSREAMPQIAPSLRLRCLVPASGGSD